MKKIKDVLCDITKYAYGENCNQKYYRFFVETSDETRASFHGQYFPKTHKIVIYNTYRDDEAILCTIVHELAHHIDHCNRNISDHQAPFYKVYEKLLYTAMDMGIINKRKFLESTSDASDSGKIKKMMDVYIPRPIPYKQNMYVVSVFNSFPHKELLKNEGYHFNENTKAWEKEVSDVENERIKMENLPGVRVEISKATALHFEGKIHLSVADGDTYPLKEELKSAGFKFKNGKWSCSVESKEDVKNIVRKFPTLVIKQRK